MNNNIIIYKSDDGKINVELYEIDGNIWLNQKQIVDLFQSSKSSVSEHIKNIFEEKELDETSVVRKFRTTAQDGKNYNVTYYNLEIILAVGFRIRGKRGTEFRIWANTILKEYLKKGFVMDDERLKNPNDRWDYFDELLARIRDIRASEKRFYQKVKDLFTLSIDYDKTNSSIITFFANTQNKLLFAVTGKTAAELIVSRADSNEKNMGLTSFKGSIVRKEDIYIAKNYLTEDELDTLNRFVIVFLETAELKAKNREYITMDFWYENIDKIIEFNDKKVLNNTETISHDTMKKIVSDRYNEFDKKRKEHAKLIEDKNDLAEIEKLEQKLKGEKNEKN